MNQFIEGLPGIIEKADTTYFDTSGENFDNELLAFFEDYLTVTDNPDALADSRFGVSRDRGNGLYVFTESLAGNNELTAAKGQITGPFTMLTGITDAAKKLGYYDPTIREMMVKGLAAKAAWQVGLLKKLAVPVLLFIDEPALAGLGSSSFVGVSGDDIAQDLGEVIGAIQNAGGLAGVHVCANTDWSLLLSCDLDVLSFDAYGFADRLLTCREQVHAFLERGGILAWGVVPTGEKENIINETTETLTKRLEDGVASLAGEGWSVEKILGRLLVTPSCGTGSLPQDLAKRVLTLTHDVSRAIRTKYSL